MLNPFRKIERFRNSKIGVNLYGLRADKNDKSLDQWTLALAPVSRMLLAIRLAASQLNLSLIPVILMHILYFNGFVANCFAPPNRLY
jgi:hypothetical protein